MVTVKIKNIKKIEDAIKKYGDDAVKEFANVTKINAQETESQAKSFAPVDNGTLRQSIRAEQQEHPLNYKVTAYMPYSAYQEFGTGGLVDIPEGWAEMAAQFKGKGIKQVNIMPHPFMYPAFRWVRTNFNKDIKEAIKYLNKKFNG